MIKQIAAVMLLFFALGFLVFYPALLVGFVSDDYIWLKESQNPQQYDLFDSQSLVFTKGRPGTMALFFVLFKLFSADASKFHLVMLTFHILNAVLLLAVLRRLKLEFSFSFLTALIFLIHFSNEETIFWASCLSSIFCLFFYLGAVFFHLIKLKIAVLACSFIALSIREDALTIPITLLLLEYVSNREAGSKIWDLVKRNLIFFLPSIIYTGFRILSATNESMGYDFTLNPAIWAQNGAYFVLNLFIHIRYIFDQFGYELHETLLQKIAALQNYSLLAVGETVLLAAAVYLTIKFKKRILGLAKNGMFLSLVGLLPYLPMVGNAPRFFYFALVGGALLVTSASFGISRHISKERPEVLAAAFGIALTGLSFFVIRERGGWWIHSSRVAAEILEQTRTHAEALAPGDTLYVANLPHRINGAHVFHQRGYTAWSLFEEAVALSAPELAGRVRYLGDKNLKELQESRGRKVFMYVNGKLQKAPNF